MTRLTFNTAALLFMSGCLLFSSSLLADDQAPESRPTSVQSISSASTSPSQQAGSGQPLSAVELMMQQQQQSATEQKSLPPKEIQPGETIKVKTFNEPRRGASMNEVTKILGTPLSKKPAVGQPPITKWIYNDRVVVFEYSSVIDVVAL